MTLTELVTKYGKGEIELSIPEILRMLIEGGATVDEIIAEANKLRNVNHRS